MSELLAIPALFVLAGLTAAVFPRPLADFKERVDAVGSTRENQLDEVASNSSQVFLVRVVGVSLVVLGLVTFRLVLSG